MVSWQGSVVNKVISSLCKISNPSFEFDIAKRRLEIEKIAARFKTPKDIITEKFEINHLTAEWFYVPEHNSNIILYLHGGGFVIGSINTHRKIIAKIAQLTSCRVLAINYRLAPEHPFPAAVEDAFLTYHWLLQQNIFAKNIIVVGDSAGGNLAITTGLLARDKNMPLPKTIACLSPWLDLTLSGESFLNNTKTDPVLKRQLVEKIAQYYVQDRKANLPLISPIFADLANFPPLYIQVSSSEVLFSDAVRLAEKARAAGVEVDLKIYMNMMHGWQFLSPWVPEAKKSLKDLSEFILEHAEG